MQLHFGFRFHKFQHENYIFLLLSEKKTATFIDENNNERRVTTFDNKYTTVLVMCFAENGSNSMKGCGVILAFLSWVLVALSFPLSLCVCIKVIH